MMKRTGGLIGTGLLLLVFVLVEAQPAIAQGRRGTLTYTDGSRYEGEIRNGKRHGQGTYTWTSGNRYEGQFRDSKMHGRGTYTCSGLRLSSTGPEIIAIFGPDYLRL